jgi:hypothetical protein
LDGSAAIELPTQTVNSVTFNNSFTISIWIAFGKSGLSDANIIKLKKDGKTLLNMAYSLKENLYYMTCQPADDTSTQVEDPDGIVDTKWHFVVCTQSFERAHVEIWTDFTLRHRQLVKFKHNDNSTGALNSISKELPAPEQP